jgi:S-adenosyl-L-methionine hydrolase (adenosine-forming)
LSRQVITLTTDFGLADHFVGVVKGVILNINPEVQLVDLSHQVNSFDPLDVALTVGLNYKFFPTGTIHLVVVDPGVGSARRPILSGCAGHTFVAPDNGVLSLVWEGQSTVEVRHVTAEHYFLRPVSRTFHGRDVFAPVAGWLSRSAPPASFGELIEDYVRITLPRPARVGNNLAGAKIVKVDKFGNLLTNVTAQDFPELVSPGCPSLKILINGREVTGFVGSFAEGSASEPFSYLGSSGFLEIGVNRGSAAELLGAVAGTEIRVQVGDHETE